MRYRIASLVITIMLLAVPIFGQEISPIIVETPRTTVPTTVITGEPFTQTYLVKFIDLTFQGEEIVVQEMGLNPGMLGNFEVLSFHIVLKYSINFFSKTLPKGFDGNIKQIVEVFES